MNILRSSIVYTVLASSIAQAMDWSSGTNLASDMNQRTTAHSTPPKIQSTEPFSYYSSQIPYSHDSSSSSYSQHYDANHQHFNTRLAPASSHFSYFSRDPPWRQVGDAAANHQYYDLWRSPSPLRSAMSDLHHASASSEEDHLYPGYLQDATDHISVASSAPRESEGSVHSPRSETVDEANPKLESERNIEYRSDLKDEYMSHFQGIWNQRVPDPETCSAKELANQVFLIEAILGSPSSLRAPVPAFVSQYIVEQDENYFGKRMYLLRRKYHGLNSRRHGGTSTISGPPELRNEDAEIAIKRIDDAEKASQRQLEEQGQQERRLLTAEDAKKHMESIKVMGKLFEDHLADGPIKRTIATIGYKKLRAKVIEFALCETSSPTERGEIIRQLLHYLVRRMPEMKDKLTKNFHYIASELEAGRTLRPDYSTRE